MESNSYLASTISVNYVLNDAPKSTIIFAFDYLTSSSIAALSNNMNSFNENDLLNESSLTVSSSLSYLSSSVSCMII